MSQQQFVSLIICSMRQAHGCQAPAVILKQARAYERSAHPDLATIWRKAHEQLVSLPAKTTQLAELGYLLEDAGSAERDGDA